MQKTTVLGILTIVSVVLNGAIQFLSGHPVDYVSIIAAVTTGVGLIHAADNKPAAPKV